METNLLDRMLNTYLAAQTPVTVTLQNKTRVSGRIKAFDSYVIVMQDLKSEIVYRHAISCITLRAPGEQKSISASQKPAQPKPAVRPVRTAPQKPRAPQQQTALAASSGEPSINNSMKEGLLKWMREQKAAK